MSVVQISRIQQRRGKKNTNTGIPQLASGELAWAIDTQELYIGNGAVSEGAPYVGNTKILTEHEDLLALSNAYQFKRNDPNIQTGSSPTVPVERTIQDRLDDSVNSSVFGVVADGIYNNVTGTYTGTDNTVALQRAIDQVFLNSANKSSPSSRTVLQLNAGIYIISAELKIPPYAHIVGTGIDSTIIVQIGSAAAMRTVDGASIPGTYIQFGSINSLTRPRYIYMSGMTIKTQTANRVLYLDNTYKTVFDRIKFEGIYQTNTVLTSTTSQIGVDIRGTGAGLRTENVLFNFCTFEATGIGIYSNYDSNNVSLHNCTFYQLYDGIYINDGGDIGISNMKVDSCYFDVILRYGVCILKGSGNTTLNNKFMLVGCNNNNYALPVYPIIRFDSDNNNSMNDYFERNTRLKDQSTFSSSAFMPNVKTAGMIYDNFSFHKTLTETLAGPIAFLRFPLNTSGRYVIEYVITQILDSTHTTKNVRSGSIYITADKDNADCITNETFSYTGDQSKVESIYLTPQIIQAQPSSTGVDTLIINVYNPSGNGTKTVNYTYRMMTQ